MILLSNRVTCCQPLLHDHWSPNILALSLHIKDPENHRQTNLMLIAHYAPPKAQIGHEKTLAMFLRHLQSKHVSYNTVIAGDFNRDPTFVKELVANHNLSLIHI